MTEAVTAEQTDKVETPEEIERQKLIDRIEAGAEYLIRMLRSIKHGQLSNDVLETVALGITGLRGMLFDAARSGTAVPKNVVDKVTACFGILASTGFLIHDVNERLGFTQADLRQKLKKTLGFR